MWSGAIADVPANWSFCDGSDGTPDLRDRFIVCAKQDDAGVAKTNITGALTQTGGNTEHTHTQAAGVDLGSSVVNAWSTNEHINPYYALAYIMHNPGV